MESILEPLEIMLPFYVLLVSRAPLSFVKKVVSDTIYSQAFVVPVI